MAKYGLLAVPLKTTNEVDLIKPLSSYIDTVYNTSDDNKAEIAEAVQELNKLRTKACCQPQDKHQSALDGLTRYYDQLLCIENKIIISATQNPVVFKWKDAFDKGSLFSKAHSLSIADGSYERACVLFNCGALMSQIAASQLMLTDDEMKTSAKLFQQASGVYSHLRDTVLGLVQQDPTPDLLPDTLTALSALMVAQAQECIYIKASKDKMKNAALAKISSQVGDFYQEAYKLMSKDVVKGIWEKDWLSGVNSKAIAFQALSQYHQAMVDSEEKKIGDQLSRLTEAIKLSETASKYLPLDSVLTTEAFHPMKKAYETAKKDNDFIYHERVTDFRSLPPVPRAVLAKPTPLANPMTPRFKDMFVNLVPLQVLNAMQSYESKKGEVVNIESARLREHTQIMNGILASLNLPAALDDVTSTETLPESIKQKSGQVKQAGGYQELIRMFGELPTLYTRNQEILDETHRLLAEEKENDDKLRGQFGNKWSRMASDQLTGPLVQEIGKYRGILHTASTADKLVKDKFEANRVGIELLSKNEAELKSSIPGQQAHSTAAASETVQKLRSLMEKVQKIKTDREKLEKDLKGVKCDLAADLLKSLNDSQLLNDDALSKEKIAQNYGPLKEKVNASIAEQEQLLAEVQTSNTKFTQEKTGSSGGAERERVLKQLAMGFDSFNELKANLQEGTKFYNDLTPILVRLQQKVTDFVFARNTEKTDLMQQMQQNIISGGSGAPGASAPPPRPPPPRPTDAASAPQAPPRTMSQGQQQQPPPQQQQQQQQMMPQMPQQPPYFTQQYPMGQPQPFFQQQFQPPNPYMTYPGAVPNYQNYGQFPGAPQYGQYQQMPYQQQQQQPPMYQQQQQPQQPPANNNNPFQ